MNNTDLKILLQLIQQEMPGFYEYIENRAGYPDYEDYDHDSEYDDAVDKSELRELANIILEELNE